MSWEVIMPFLRPIEPFLRDPDVSDILVNGPDHLFVEKAGVMERIPNAGLTEKSLQIAIRHIARTLGDDVSLERPLLDARLPDGSRVAAVLPPCSMTGTIMAIRKFHGARYSADELVRVGSLPPTVLPLLQNAVANRKNILISGGTGTGKTTLLNALAAFIPEGERIVVIEDTAEIQIHAENVVRLEARREQPSLPPTTLRDLLKTTLRLRPDRILVGEVRGGEAFDLLSAMNTGHAGTIATLHATSAAQAVTRFTTCVLQSAVEIPYSAVRRNIADAIDILVHIDRRRGKRLVTQICSMKGYDAALDRYNLDSIYECQ